MPRKRTSKRSTAKGRKLKRTSKPSGAKGRKSKRKRATATKSRKKRVSRAAFPVKRTAMKMLAGAAAGAVRAIMPPLEKAAGSQGVDSKERER